MASEDDQQPQETEPEPDLPSEADIRELCDVTVLVANDHDRGHVMSCLRLSAAYRVCKAPCVKYSANARHCAPFESGACVHRRAAAATGSNTALLPDKIMGSPHAVKRLWHTFKGPDLDAAKRRQTAEEMLRDLTQHTAAEQDVLYPTMREIASLKDQVHHELSEHASLVVLMCDVLALPRDDDAALVAKMDSLMEVFLSHIHAEEHVVLARLREELSAEQLRELGRRFEKARMHAHTNPNDLMREGSREELGDEDDLEQAEEDEQGGDDGSTDDGDVVERVMNAHDGVKRLFHELRDPAVDDASRAALGQTLVEELTAVTAAEQEVLYPVLRENLGDQHVDHVLSMDASLVSIMCDLTTMDQQKDQRSYTSKINALMDVFQHHMRDEEHEGLARLRKLLPQQELRELGKRYGEAITRAPKRPQLLAVGGEGRDA